jgi:O-antigen/teichoic acid export membrane protein
MRLEEFDKELVWSTKGMYRRIARNSAFLAGGTAASSLLIMLSVAIAARALSAREFGVLVLLQSAVLMLSALTSFSTQQPVIKLGSDALVTGDMKRLGEIISMGLLVDIFASVLALIVAALAVEFSRSAIGLATQDVGSAWILAASLLFTGYPTSNGIFRLYDRFGLLSLIQTFSAAGLLLAYLALYIAGSKLQIFVLVWAIYLASNSLLQLWFGLYLIRRNHVPLHFRRQFFSGEDGRTLLSYCWSTWGTSTTETIRTNGDSLLVGAIVSVEAAGIYTVARQLSGILRKLNVVYRSTVFPEIARLASRNDIAGAWRLNKRMLIAGLAIGVLTVGLAIVFGHFVIRLLFGMRFTAAYIPVVILTAAAIAQLISFTPSMCVQVFRGPKTLLLLYVIVTIVFAAAAVPLTFALSITGMALAQLVFSIALTFLCNLVLQQAVMPQITASDLPSNHRS